jgi:NAD(P) transhydrogenase
LNKSDGIQSMGWAIAGTAVSAVNIFGGFIVSKRMLSLFKRKEDVDFSNFWIIPGILFIVIVALYQKELRPVETLCGLMCIIAIGGLASMKTSRQGCMIGISAVAAAVVATVIEVSMVAKITALICLGIGGGLGVVVGVSVDPIKLPQTVAGFHSLVGLAAMVTSVGNYAITMKPGVTMENVFCCLGCFIGGITLTGSIIAFLKLDARMSSTAWDLPGKNYINIASLTGFFALTYFFLTTSHPDFAMLIMYGIAGLACWMGVHLVASVGGGDMPVCITVLNSYSGWALVAEGFMLNSALLTIVGSLIGFSGGILTHIMCVAMNRDIANVLFGGMNTTVAIKLNKDEEEPMVHKEIKADAVADQLADAKKVMIIPGYGMAVARAQSPVASIASTLKNNDVEVKFGIHPVAGRMPGQMNVLLAEAGVPYDWVFELDEVNDEMEGIDVCLVVGANDITNIAANDVEGCPIYGMPVFSVWLCKSTIFFKRSMRPGYADLPNPCFYKENAWMCLGNADKTCDDIAGALKGKF